MGKDPWEYNPDWMFARANVWLERFGREPAKTLDEARARVRSEIQCTSAGGMYSPCARCGEFNFPCPDPVDKNRLYQNPPRGPIAEEGETPLPYTEWCKKWNVPEFK